MGSTIVYEEYKEGYFTDNKYEGEIENGKPHGNRTWIQSDGGTYVGQYINKQRKSLKIFKESYMFFRLIYLFLVFNRFLKTIRTWGFFINQIYSIRLFNFPI